MTYRSEWSRSRARARASHAGKPPAMVTWVPGWIHIEAPYKPAFVRDLKDHLPRHARVYHREHRLWKVNATHAERAIGLVKVHFPDVITSGSPTSSPFVGSERTAQADARGPAQLDMEAS